MPDSTAESSLLAATDADAHTGAADADAAASRSYDFLAPAYFADPHPTLRGLRETDPVHWCERLRRWVITRHDDAVAILRDFRRFSSAVVPQIPPADRQPEMVDFACLSSRWLFFLDPPAHGPRRSAVAGQFTPRAAETLRPFVRATAERLLDRAMAAGGMDLVADFAFPLAAGVIAELLCRTSRDKDRFLACCRDIESAGLAARNSVARQRGFRGIAGVTALVREFAASQPHALDEEAAAAHCLVLVFAGIETTQNLIGNSVLALLRHPEQARVLRDEPERVGSAVEECLRYEPPVLGVVRRTCEDAEMRGRVLRRDDELLVMTAAANRDPAAFPAPDILDIRRPKITHLSLGLGIHFCLGAALARLEAAVALETLLCRAPGLRLDDDAVITWRDHDPIVRGLKGLPVAF